MMQFKRNLQEKHMEVNAFTGADFSHAEADLALHTAADMANVYVDALGCIKKRTGYKKLLQCDGKVNGIFLYTYYSGTEEIKQYLVHCGTKLYLAEFAADGYRLGTCISTELADKKSRSFSFGGALYLLGAGYFKIAWDPHYKMLICGRVCHTETNAGKNCVLMQACSEADTSFSGERSTHIDAECMYKEMLFKEATYGFAGKTKLYVAPAAIANQVRICDVYYTASGASEARLDPMHYKVLSDAYGLYVLLSRADISFKQSLSCSLRIVLLYNGFVYTPANIINRTPTKMASLDTGLLEGEEAMYDGTLLEDYNLSAPHRATEFYITDAQRKGAVALRLYLESENAVGSVLRVYVNGELLQKYTLFLNGHSEPCVGSYRCAYFELETRILPEGDSTVRVEYIKTAESIAKQTEYVTDACSVFGIFGGKNDTRVFLSGNPKYMGRDYASALYDGTYFPDTGYTTVGSDQSAILGYHKISGYQVIIKDGKNFDASQYLRSYKADAEGKAVFTVMQGAQGVGAASASSFKTCRDHMLFAAADGVYEIRSTDVAAQTNLKYLSEPVSVRIKAQPLAEAVCAVVDGKYCLCVGTQMYILDTLRDMHWYFYKDLPQICCMYVENETLYFGAADGGIYRFMSETEENAYYDNVGTDGDLKAAHAIHAYWDIPVTTLGCGYERKSIEDLAVYLAPQNKTSLRVLYTTEFFKDAVRHIEKSGRFDFSKVDFSDFSFEASDYPVCINTRAKAKRVRVFGARLENAVSGEGMAVTGFAVRYREKNRIK